MSRRPLRVAGHLSHLPVPVLPSGAPPVSPPRDHIRASEVLLADRVADEPQTSVPGCEPGSGQRIIWRPQRVGAQPARHALFDTRPRLAPGAPEPRLDAGDRELPAVDDERDQAPDLLLRLAADRI
jgi:hypothetical protein